MALNDENGGIPATMLVGPASFGNTAPYPVYMGGQQGGFGNGFGGDGWWIILLFILLAGNNGWGNGFGGGNGGGNELYPWMNQAEITSDGFRDQLINNNVTSIRDGVSNLSTQLCNCCGDIQMALCNGFAGVNSGVANGFAQAEIAANGRQMANMNQAFAAQTAMAQGFNALSSQFADCCCENRLASADLKYTIATENCADRAALAEGIRDIITAQNAGIQSIKDQLCQDKIDAKNETIAQLRQELLFARGQASQDVQTAQLRAGQVAEVDALYSRLRDCPVPTMPVYGMTPIFTCNNGCGCGGNSGCGCGTSGF